MAEEIDNVSNENMDIGIEIMKAINEIREKKKRPCEDTIMALFEKKSIGVQREGVTSALKRLEEAKLIENRAKNGEDSYFVLDSGKIDNGTKLRLISCNGAGEFTPYTEFIKLQRTVESLKIAMEEKLELKGEPTGVDTEKVLRKEIAMLKTENEALRKELKKKELILQSVKHVETSKPKLSRSIWSDDDEDLVSPTIPTYSKEVKFIYPQRKHTGKAKNVASLTSNDVGFIHMNRFGAIGDKELDFPALSVGDAVGPSEAPFSISKQPEDRPATIRRKQTVTRNLEQGNIKRKNDATTRNDAVPKDFTEIIGDSIVKDIKGFKMTEATNGEEKIKVQSYSGATVDHMNSHAIPTMKRNPKKINLHCGTNDIRSSQSPEEIAIEMLDLASAMKTSKNTIYVSSLVQRGDQWNGKVTDVNRHLKGLCKGNNLPFIDNDNIKPFSHLNRSKLHLNPEDTRILANNFLKVLGHY